ncbi:hypothetical protein [Malacoplasma iowae]|uniref:hypothetical protein n=1 Tax=Malacoplasma iowae TaxID=2116 RepID=UPI0038730CD7|nr:hypothetical protein QX184_01725 [Malacoplasma iowae]
MKKAFILNKQFSGEWLDNDNNIAHEIIDFLLTDNDEHYVYNLPYGFCNEKIWVNGTDESLRNNKQKYIAKYLLLCDKFTNKKLNIEYVIELEKKIHSYSQRKRKFEIENNKQMAKEIIIKNNIKYNDRYLYELFHQSDECQSYVTFKALRMYKRAFEIKDFEIELSEYNFQRNRGYLYEDKHPEDYKKIELKIEECIKNGKLELFKPINIKSLQKQEKIEIKKTFIDLCMFNYNEQVFTNILYTILSYKNVFNLFLEEFYDKDLNYNELNFILKKEHKIKGGRIDIYASNNNKKIGIVIENKIISGLNGINDKNYSQLDTYYKWNKENHCIPLSFLFVPNYKENEIKSQMNKQMKEKYKIIKYSDIHKFLNKINSNKIFDDARLTCEVQRSKKSVHFICFVCKCSLIKR